MDIETIVIERLRGSQKWLNKSQLAAVLGISWHQLQSRIARGEIPEGNDILGKPRWNSHQIADLLEGIRDNKLTELNRAQAARRFNVNVKTLDTWLANELLPPPDRVSPAGRKYWRQATLDKFEHEQTGGFKLGERKPS